MIENDWWPRLGIPETAIAGHSALVGTRRLQPLRAVRSSASTATRRRKLLEYNADTPTALVEASVAQWFWLQDTHPEADQFNSIHERLIEAWRRWAGTTIHFSSIKDQPEDETDGALPARHLRAGRA